MADANMEFYRVFAYGPGHGMQISERLRKDAAEKRRKEMHRSMPLSDIRIKKVDEQGRAISSSGCDS